MRYRYRPVYGDGRLIAIVFETGRSIFSVFFTDHFFGVRTIQDVREGAVIDALEPADYPTEVSGAYRELVFGPVLESEELPRIEDNASAREVRDWLRGQRERLELR